MTEQDMWNIARCVVADAFEQQSCEDHDAGRTEQAKRTRQVATDVRAKITCTPPQASAEPINPDKIFWDELEASFQATYHGGYRTPNDVEIFQHGMNTVFNYLRGNSVALFGEVAFSAMREQLQAMESQRDEARKELAWFKDRLGEIAKYGRVQE